jgi:hypothetical protein
MNKQQIENFISDMIEETVTIHKQTVVGKWYEQKYSSQFDTIELSQIYGVSIAGNISGIDFDFKTAKKEDNLLKTIATQVINKHLTKQYELIEGCLQHPTKEQCINKLKSSNRVSKYFFYTTLYGIGFFSMFMSNNIFNNSVSKLGDYLKSKKVSYSNEYSDAHWVYRFVINKDVTDHNTLLNNFELT